MKKLTFMPILVALLATGHVYAKVQKPKARKAKTAKKVVQAPRARKATTKTAQAKVVEPLLQAIKQADLTAIRKMELSSKVVNAHNKSFSPLGLAYSKLRENKENPRLTRGEKSRMTRNLNKIVNALKEKGATHVLQNYKISRKKSPAQVAKAA